jgi:hypothetical protein
MGLCCETFGLRVKDKALLDGFISCPATKLTETFACLVIDFVDSFVAHGFS